MTLWRIAAVLAVGLVGSGLTGCGTGGGDTATLRGKVTVNGKPLTVGTLTAHRGSSKVTETTINPDGTYEFSNLSGGEYQLTVTGTDTPTPYGPPVLLPAKYADASQSGLVGAVTSGRVTTQDLSLQTK